MRTDFQQIIASPVAAYQELIKIKNLTADYAEELNSFVREKFLELQSAVENAE